MRHICCTMTRIRALPPLPPPPPRVGGEWQARVVFVRRPMDLFTAGRAGTARKGRRASPGVLKVRSSVARSLQAFTDLCLTHTQHVFVFFTLNTLKL